MSDASKEELMVKTVTEIVSALIKAHQDGKDVDLNRYEFHLLLFIRLLTTTREPDPKNSLI